MSIAARTLGLWWATMSRSRESVTAFNPAALSALLQARGYTIAELAEQAGLYRQNLNSILTGNRPAAFTTVLDLADALNVDPLELTTINPHQPTLQGLRLQRRLQRVQLAERVGSSYAQLHAIETGRRPLTDAYAATLADILNTTPDRIRDAVNTQLGQP